MDLWTYKDLSPHHISTGIDINAIISTSIWNNAKQTSSLIIHGNSHSKEPLNFQAS